MITNYADHSSNERTFLAWVRTAVAIVGFGLASARLRDTPAPLWSEVLMLIAGGVVVLVAYLRMRHLRKRIDAQDSFDDGAMASDAFLALLVAAVFVLLALFAIHVS
ncbi:YidH family protein [Pararhodobacter zhoushanensis]|uniref:YidH family protein n=1 Tax=Pararhodobacter zhoushanensis TaxID=2479545 RepID=UPI000F8F111F|nr:DUF202 domain-containing protein [Pararhodobacter zhoushanensis]